MSAAALAVLRETFGHPAFRGPQEEIVDHLVSGGDALVLMPTGGGKSLCYQVPSLMRKGTGVIVSPLIALMDGDTPIIGIIDQPVTGERWVGARGMATRFRGPFGGVAGTRPCPTIGQAELGATTPDMFMHADAAPWARLTRAAGRTYYGGDCYTYGLVALGQIDICVDATMKIWDWAALVPVVEGAGGRVTDWNGRPMHPDGDGRTLAVGDPALLPQVLDILAS